VRYGVGETIDRTDGSGGADEKEEEEDNEDEPESDAIAHI